MTQNTQDVSGESAQTIKMLVLFKYAALLLAIGVFAGGAQYGAVKVLRWIESDRKSPKLATLIDDEVQALTRASGNDSQEKPDSNRKQSIHMRLPDAPFVDLAGRPGSLREYQGKVLVVSMTSVGCPISQKLVPALGRLTKEFGGDRTEFLLVNADGAASGSNLEEHAALFPGWRYVSDNDKQLTQTLSARTTTESFVIDAAQTLRYRGAVDDRFDIGVNRNETGNDYVRDAIAAVLHDEILSIQATESPGCLLRTSVASELAPQVTWYNQISRLVQYNCVECHRPGEAAPFSLQTYEQVVAKAAMIEYVLEERIMPPWFADHAYGQWRNDRYVSDAEQEMFRQWAADGHAKGNPDDAPMPLARTTGWTIQEPDVVIDVEPQDVPAEGITPWRLIPVEFEVKEDLWVSEAEIRPSVPEVVHHAMLFVEYPEDDLRRSTQTGGEAGKSAGSTGFWLSYFPGRKAMILPPGRGKLIPRNGKIFIQLHYNPNGMAKVDNPKIGLKLLSAPPEKAVVSGAVVKWDIHIPPNTKALFVHSETFDEDVRLLALMPHMHYRGSAAQVFLRRPDGQVETLLHVPKYDFDWQVAYELRQPLLVTRGSEMIIRHEFDNREENPNNPDPMQTLVHGDNTTDEMMINFFDWEPAGDGSPPDMKNRPFK